MMRRVLKISAIVLFPLGMILLLGFITKKQAGSPLKGLEISIHANHSWDFVREIDIQNQLASFLDTSAAIPLETIDCQEIENHIRGMSAVKTAEVYKTIGGKLRIELEQRKPIARLFNGKGQSAYLDEDGILMPPLRHTTARVLIVNGNLNMEFFTGSHVSDSVYLSTPLTGIYELARLVERDPFLLAQVQQVYVNENYELEVVPRVGNHTIVLGETAQLEEKFEKLRLLYSKGFNPSDWNKYSKIDLTYKDQIICTKK